jgi:hypothetical protein
MTSSQRFHKILSELPYCLRVNEKGKLAVSETPLPGWNSPSISSPTVTRRANHLGARVWSQQISTCPPTGSTS